MWLYRSVCGCADVCGYVLLCTDVIGCAVVCGCVLASVDLGLYVYGCVDACICWCVSVVCE